MNANDADGTLTDDVGRVTTGPASVHRVRALEDDALDARIVGRLAMRYAAGAHPADDRPEYVRAASGLTWVGDRLAVIQDDASFLVLVDPETGLADAFPLPAGTDGVRQFDDARGNKARKMDLEAVALVPAANGVLLAAFGSGSLAPREAVVLISFARAASPRIVVQAASEFYARLRAATGFAGSDMNIEGALYIDGALKLFGRGNGAVVGELRPINASCNVIWTDLMAHLEHPSTVTPPAPRDITQYDLGTLDMVPLGFTDATRGCGNAVLYAAAAESSPDATRDGEVHGSVMGAIKPGALTARWTVLRDEMGQRFVGKIEGLASDKVFDDRVFAVVDSDDDTRPSELLEVALSGPWWQ
jgi:hypothetical protein